MRTDDKLRDRGSYRQSETGPDGLAQLRSAYPAICSPQWGRICAVVGGVTSHLFDHVLCLHRRSAISDTWAWNQHTASTNRPVTSATDSP